MPPKRAPRAKKDAEPEPIVMSSSDSESVDITPAKSVMTSASRLIGRKPVALVNFTNTNSKTSNTSDRLQLAQAINNLVFKGDAFTSALEQLHEMTNERLTELDLQLESKQQEYEALLQKIDCEQTTKVSSLQQEYQSLEKELNSNYENNKKDLDRNYENRVKELELNFKNSQIETTQKLREHKLKACGVMATENGMLLVEKSDNDKLIAEKNAFATELKQLKDKFDATVKAEVGAEKGKFQAQLQQEKTTMELTYKMQTADVNAQVTQLQKEVTVLNKMLDNLKTELAEQRNLTKEVASSASRSAINQSFGNK
jgi:hypothetical protein